MSRKHQPDKRARRAQADLRVEAIMKLGYFIVEFCDTHYLIQDRIEFWPTTGRWSDRQASANSIYRKPNGTGGIVGLVAYLHANVSTDPLFGGNR